MATFIPEQPDGERFVYDGGEWDPVNDVVTGGQWEQPTHGGLCRSIHEPRPAVIGPHSHWNGEYDMVCPLGEHCSTPSCHAVDAEWLAAETERTRQREAYWARVQRELDGLQ